MIVERIDDFEVVVEEIGEKMMELQMILSTLQSILVYQDILMTL